MGNRNSGRRAGFGQRVVITPETPTLRAATFGWRDAVGQERLAFEAAPLGGVQTWLICPRSGKACRKLYWHPGIGDYVGYDPKLFAHLSQNLSKPYRLAYRALRLRRKAYGR